MRDDFKAKTREILAKRVNYLCSNPDCRKLTIGPNIENSKATVMGVAAHITAASPQGPRYNINMSVDERRSAANGIWLCQNCSILVDKDYLNYDVNKLKEWKQTTENFVYQSISNTKPNKSSEIALINSTEYKTLEKSINQLKELVSLTTDEEKKATYIKELSLEKRKLNEFKKGVIALSKIFQKSALNSDRLQTVLKHFNNSNFNQAKDLLTEDNLIQDQTQLMSEVSELELEQDKIYSSLENNSKEFLILAILTSMDYSNDNRYTKSIEYFELSLKSFRSVECLFSYAKFLADHNELDQAINLMNEMLERQKLIKKMDSNIDIQYNALAHFYIGAWSKEDKDFESKIFNLGRALQGFENIDSEIKNEFLEQVVNALILIGNTYRKNRQLDAAKTFYERVKEKLPEIKDIDRELYLTSKAGNLLGYANLYVITREFKLALNSINESIALYQSCEERKDYKLLHAYLVKGHIQYEAKYFQNSEVALSKALSINLELEIDRTIEITLLLSNNYTGLGLSQIGQNKLEEAEKSFLNAHKIYQNLYKNAPNSFMHSLSISFHNLGLLYSKRNDLEKAEENFKQSLVLKRILALKNHNENAILLSTTLINLGLLFTDLKYDKEKAFKYIDEALDILLPFYEIPEAQYLIVSSKNIMEKLKVDFDDYIKEKLR